jgi:hypothetical protein
MELRGQLHAPAALLPGEAMATGPKAVAKTILVPASNRTPVEKPVAQPLYRQGYAGHHSRLLR